MGCPAFLVQQFRLPHHTSSGGTAEARPEEHGLDLDAVHHGFNTLLRVRPGL